MDGILKFLQEEVRIKLRISFEYGKSKKLIEICNSYIFEVCFRKKTSTTIFGKFFASNI